MDNASPLVNIEWLSQQLDKQLNRTDSNASEREPNIAIPNIVIIDTRFSLQAPEQGRNQYQAGHIPGAYYLDLNQDLSGPIKKHGGRHPLPNWDPFISKLNQLGIHSAPPKGPTQIVIYDDSRFAFAARAWWMLRYLGHQQVAILDGGIQAWRKAGLPLSPSVPPARAGSFKPQPQSDWIVDIETIKQQKDLPNSVVIDSRSPERWRGEIELIDPIAGSVAGSINAFWKDVSTAEGELKSIDELRAHWSQLSPEDDVMVYCGSGVTACVNLFSLVMAGHPMHKLYPGGWSDWCSYLSTNTNEN